ncbi:hypothetical protein ABVT39_006349 [Epinephelus coioides]
MAFSTELMFRAPIKTMTDCLEEAKKASVQLVPHLCLQVPQQQLQQQDGCRHHPGKRPIERPATSSCRQLVSLTPVTMHEVCGNKVEDLDIPTTTTASTKDDSHDTMTAKLFSVKSASQHGAIAAVPLSEAQPGFFSPYFLVPKKSGGMRLIWICAS